MQIGVNVASIMEDQMEKHMTMKTSWVKKRSFDMDTP